MRRRRHGQAIEAVEPDKQEREILRALAALRETSVREVMTPRVDVVALAEPVTAEDVARAVKESGHSRFPVFHGDLDHLIGVLFVKDLFRMSDEPSPAAIARRLRKPFFLPEAKRVLEALGEMRGRRNAFGVVVDEHGGVEGVITVKDLVSELVGDLPDEFDRPEDALVSRVDVSRWLVDGACTLADFEDEIGLELPDGEYVTVGGFLLDRFGRIPEEGDTVLHDGWEFRIAEMERRRIAKVVVRAPSDTMTAQSAGK